jgi:ABC-2 type transport system ATP-binding protein
MKSTVIEVQDLKKHYGETRAVDGVSFELIEGEVLAILGPNGAGKTTTLEMLEGLRKPDSGHIAFFSEGLAPADIRVKERIGVQLQTSSFFRFLTVKETLDLFRGLYSKNVPTDTLIAELSLEEKRHTLTKNLSGGQLQRLAIAVALVNDPELVFLDEPATGLDPQARRMQWETVRSLKKAGKSIVLTTHYMEEAEYLADRIIIMDQGRIVASGCLEELISSIGAENLISFRTGDNAAPPAALIEAKGLKDSGDGVWTLSTRNVSKDLTELYRWSEETGLRLDDISIRRPNLDDVFLAITGHTLRD